MDYFCRYCGATFWLCVWIQFGLMKFSVQLRFEIVTQMFLYYTVCIYVYVICIADKLKYAKAETLNALRIKYKTLAWNRVINSNTLEKETWNRLNNDITFIKQQQPHWNDNKCCISIEFNRIMLYFLFAKSFFLIRYNEGKRKISYLGQRDYMFYEYI